MRFYTDWILLAKDASTLGTKINLRLSLDPFIMILTGFLPIEADNSTVGGEHKLNARNYHCNLIVGFEVNRK